MYRACTWALCVNLAVHQDHIKDVSRCTLKYWWHTCLSSGQGTACILLHTDMILSVRTEPHSQGQRRRVGLGRTDLILERTGCNWTILVCSGLYWTTLLELLDRAALNWSTVWIDAACVNLSWWASHLKCTLHTHTRIHVHSTAHTQRWWGYTTTSPTLFSVSERTASQTCRHLKQCGSAPMGLYFQIA